MSNAEAERVAARLDDGGFPQRKSKYWRTNQFDDLPQAQKVRRRRFQTHQEAAGKARPAIFAGQFF